METRYSLHLESALVGDHWAKNVVIGIDDGIIDSIQTDVHSEIQTADLSLDAVAIPGMPNVHSHAFQRAFAGLSEFRTVGPSSNADGQSRDSFWTWRKLMYDFLLQLSPDDVYVIARQLYLEMLSAGYTWVGEFHYLHNQVGGQKYGNLSEMSDAIFRAAQDTGIGLCHLPVLYQRGGFLNEPLAEGQKRFSLDNDSFLKIVDHCKNRVRDFATSEGSFQYGIALHSLRAVSVDNARQILESLKADGFSGPVHIHVAEQTKEVDDCLATHQRRSVEYMYSELPVNERWCLIHATHLSNDEIRSIIQSKAVVGLCPTTEANLGDGIFSATEFLGAGIDAGRISIGSDSHVSVDLSDELRTLEYGQRLTTLERAVLGSEQESVGRRLYTAAARGGAQALAIEAGEIAVGRRADFTLVDSNHASIAGAEEDRLLDRLVFCNAGRAICGTVIGGRIQMHDESFAAQMSESARKFSQLCKRLMGLGSSA